MHSRRAPRKAGFASAATNITVAATDITVALVNITVPPANIAVPPVNTKATPPVVISVLASVGVYMQETADLASSR